MPSVRFGGTLSSANISLTGLAGPFVTLNPASYSSPAFSAAPVVSTTTVSYGANNSRKATFLNAGSNLLLYVDQWRGAYNMPGSDPDTHYIFSLPFTVLPGLADSNVSPDTLRSRLIWAISSIVSSSSFQVR
jgi:hypothetical protein